MSIVDGDIAVAVWRLFAFVSLTKPLCMHAGCFKCKPCDHRYRIGVTFKSRCKQAVKKTGYDQKNQNWAANRHVSLLVFCCGVTGVSQTQPVGWLLLPVVGKKKADRHADPHRIWFAWLMEHWAVWKTCTSLHTQIKCKVVPDTKVDGLAPLWLRVWICAVP